MGPYGCNYNKTMSGCRDAYYIPPMLMGTLPNNKRICGKQAAFNFLGSKRPDL